jgi:hypothetical protein
VAISKRLRFEILRRDNHTCRYCGAAAPDAKLVVDHVLPETLGGRSEPENLVTACEPCNSGKSSIPPDAELVADVKSDAVRWAWAMKQAHEARRALRDEQIAYVNYFLAMWNEWTYGPKKLPVPLPDGWQASVERLHENNLHPDDLQYAVRAAMSAPNVRPENTFRYFCGVSWNVLRQVAETAREYFMADLAQDFEAAGVAGDEREDPWHGYEP